MTPKKFAGQTRPSEKAGNLLAEALSSKHALFVRKYEDKIIALLKEAILHDRLQSVQINSNGSNDYLSSTTTTTNQFFTNIQELFVPDDEDKSLVAQVLGYFLNFRFQNLLNQFRRRLLFLFIEVGCVHLHTRGWNSLCAEFEFKREDRKVLWEHVQKLETLWLTYHGDLLSPEGKKYRGQPNLYCLFCATEAEKRTACLDYYNHQKREKWSEVPMHKSQRTPTEEEIIKASLLKDPIHKIAKTREEAEPLYREKFKAMGYSGEKLKKQVQDSLNQHYTKQRQSSEPDLLDELFEHRDAQEEE